MKISTKSKNAVAIVSYMACFEENTVIPMSAIENTLKISKMYMAQILILLREGGIVSAKKGVGGGYFIPHSADLNTLTVGDVCRCVEKNMYVSECVFDINRCDLNKNVFECPSRNILCDISDTIFDILDSYYIIDIAQLLTKSKTIVAANEFASITKSEVKEDEKNEAVSKKQVWNTWLD